MRNRNDDPYYLGNDTQLPSKLIVKTTDITIDQELHWDASLGDFLNAFYTAMIGIGFHPEDVVGNMREFVEERDYNPKHEDENEIVY